VLPVGEIKDVYIIHSHTGFKHRLFCLVKFVGWRTLNRKE